jgi:hypothetical protein
MGAIWTEEQVALAVDGTQQVRELQKVSSMSMPRSMDSVTENCGRKTEACLLTLKSVFIVVVYLHGHDTVNQMRFNH